MIDIDKYANYEIVDFDSLLASVLSCHEMLDNYIYITRINTIQRINDEIL